MRLSYSRILVSGAACLALLTGAAPAAAQVAIQIGAPVTGELEASDPRGHGGARYDAYEIQARRGDRLAVTLESDDFDALLRIGRGRGEAFEELAHNDDAPGRGLNSRLVFAAPEDGVYVIQATAFSASARGAYDLSVEAAPPPASAQAIAIGDTARGELTPDSGPGESGAAAVLYRFEGRAGQRVAVQLNSEVFDAYLELFSDRNGVRASLAQDDDGAGQGLNARLTHTLPEDGAYVIEARDYGGGGEGAFSLSLSEIAPDPAPTPLAFGQTIEGEITSTDPRDDRGRNFDAYAISGLAGRRVQVILRSGDFDSFLEIGRVGETFEALASDDDGLGEGLDARLTYTLPDDGDYVVRALPLGSDAKGLYEIELIDRGPEPLPGSILVGATARGELSETDALDDQGVYFDAYRVHVNAGDKLRITLVSNSFDAYLEVGREAETFEALARDDDGLSDTHARLDWTAEEEGWHIIRARAYAPGQTGDYALIVEPQP